ncbi:MAG: acylneuraminate cytidylyltransferase family protein [Xenococcus sp. (in: cyanobacteria)]
MTSPLTVVALIPARSGSKRVEGKNIRLLGEHPLIAYTISAAIQSQIFSAVIVSTDSQKIAEIAHYYGAEVPFLRSPEYSGDNSPDIEWIEETLNGLKSCDRVYDCFSILRPTSPFRQPETIQRAWSQFQRQRDRVDSLRAVEKCQQHPGKMWVVRDNLIQPLLTGNEPSVSNQPKGKAPWHSTPYQALPEVYIQNASLEIAWCRVALENHTIAGDVIMPFFTCGYEGLDINDPKDWWYVEYLLQQGEVQLPFVLQQPINLIANPQ